MSKPIALSTLLAPWVDISAHEFHDMAISNLELDSRKITEGTTFVAIKGHTVDGRRFIESAINRGANAVIAQSCERHPQGVCSIESRVPVIYIDQLDRNLSALASRLYTLGDMKLVGVTGTNGKTTITQIIAQWLNLVGKRAAVLGTAGNGFLDALQPAVNTTGSAIEIQHTLVSIESQGADYTAMEISSHGLVQGRVKTLPFAAGVFTNLSRDHLDYHGTMEEYELAKRSLFTEHQCGKAIINVDDQVGAKWAEQLPDAIQVSLQPLSSTNAVFASQVEYSESGISLAFSGCFGDGQFSVPLIGEFNANNVLVAFTTLLALGIDKQQLIEMAKQLTPVIGRMELFHNEGKAKVVVDYAHTPDALEKALMALRVHCHGKLWAIFGCGGDRDTGKRPMMAEIGERLADHVVLADDNPRSESPSAIVDDMLAGMRNPERAIVEHDRFKALQYALANSEVHDIILLAGKGHEDYQVLANETVHYSDRESAQQLLELN
ncbi:UDP-N-acetylmuramoyl-L-alanyl-D-glutamate--2,6-diaminopimelate ligase [Vibrio sinaloensis]|uniref:UDP-N-acetylmuramoyl-L-alanyl-D-glutamate--2, 6-diaminopimelate ligase n=1 Tax=Photobacterium sp. (strain ATCC 43367) TaxID=379097 RepID=UPI00057D693F|nr:UDP-N-acetylmuramoyl-L-alanyl-D-glutamate--2,6-diaminopimelate ligase [Vibrio sinaloensis]KHT45393.1 UDP-N-acetylmuramoylalanyl-D-glutamate--2,6-diaminopimelate ligase [Vibrio sinaloensis]